MRLDRVLAAAAVLFGVAAASVSAQAANVTETYVFDVGGPLSGGTLGGVAVPPPVTSWTGAFTLTFDPTLTNGSGTITSFSSNVSALNSSVPGSVWSYVTVVSSGHEILAVGNDCTTTSCIYQDNTGILPNKALLMLDLGPVGALTLDHPTLTAAEFTTTSGAGTNGQVPYYSEGINGHQTVSVPEPASFGLMAAGLALLASVQFRRTRIARRAPQKAR